MKRFPVGLGAVVFLAASVPTAVEAQLIDFDDASVCPADAGLTDLTGTNYAGFNWNNVIVLNAVLFNGGVGGYNTGMVSSPCVAWNSAPSGPGMILANPTPFTFGSWFNAAWNTNLTVTVTGS